ncbi:MAG: hypothetical protein COV66_11225 [Nitrospinae bacterium CG11_big_fil_rev_8_21_14_0_20_45_15]|nr:MAG: hypothetical protein COV66_11225 [Nitrospinae bacterium CG11_big_fil_rev_8_21_14_0_20_45_15]
MKLIRVFLSNGQNALLVFGLLASLGCAKVEVTEAFKGSYDKDKNNKIISTYCQNCHIHKDFDPSEHIHLMQTDYKRTVFKKAEECRICHYVEKHLIYDQFLRKTRRPDDANRGLYKSFEREQFKIMKKSIDEAKTEKQKTEKENSKESDSKAP